MLSLNNFHDLIVIRNHLKILGESSYYNTPHKSKLFDAQRDIDAFIVNNIDNVLSLTKNIEEEKVVCENKPDNTITKITVETSDEAFEESWNQVINSSDKPEVKLRNALVDISGSTNVSNASVDISELINLNKSSSDISARLETLLVPEKLTEYEPLDISNNQIDLFEYKNVETTIEALVEELIEVKPEVPVEVKPVNAKKSNKPKTSKIVIKKNRK